MLDVKHFKFSSYGYQVHQDFLQIMHYASILTCSSASILTMASQRMRLLVAAIQYGGAGHGGPDIFPYMISHFHAPGAYDKAPAVEMHNLGLP